MAGQSKKLTPETPVTLKWDNGEGLQFERRYALDDNFMLEIIQRVRNTGSNEVTLAPYGLVSRTNTPDILNFYILHEGLIGVFDGTLKEVDYDDVVDAGTIRPIDFRRLDWHYRQVLVGGFDTGSESRHRNKVLPVAPRGDTTPLSG